jgi:hypothetical protein
MTEGCIYLGLAIASLLAARVVFSFSSQGDDDEASFLPRSGSAPWWLDGVA